MSASKSKVAKRLSFLLGRVGVWCFAAVNVAVIAAMLLTAYAQVLPPQTYPNWSWLGMVFPLPVAVDVLFILFWLTFKWRMAVLPMAGLAMCAGPLRTFCPININNESAEGTLMVMSFNVHNFSHPDTGHWEENPSLCYIMASGADIVCLQECMVAHFDRALEVFSSVYPYHATHEYGGNTLTVLSKYPIAGSERIMFESTSNCAYAHEVVIGADTVTVINCHLESYRLKPEDREAYKSIIKNPEGEENEVMAMTLVGKLVASNAVRGPQADAIDAFVAARLDEGRHVILCGDCNDPSLSYTHHRLTRHLNDAYTRAGNGLGLSYNQSGMYFRIDNILCSPGIAPRRAWVDSTFGESDHYPILAVLALPAKSQ